MSQQYLLPCPKCDLKHSVDTTRVGLPFNCQCGETLEVKTLRELRSLETPDSPKTTAGKEWSVRQGLWMLGTVLTLSGLVAFAITWFYFPLGEIPDISKEKFRKYAQNMTLQESWEQWETLKKAPIELPAFQDEHNVDKFMQVRRSFEQRQVRWLVGWGILTGVGLLVFIGGFVAESNPNSET